MRPPLITARRLFRLRALLVPVHREAAAGITFMTLYRLIVPFNGGILAGTSAAVPEGFSAPGGFTGVQTYVFQVCDNRLDRAAFVRFAQMTPRLRNDRDLDVLFIDGHAVWPPIHHHSRGAPAWRLPYLSKWRLLAPEAPVGSGFHGVLRPGRVQKFVRSAQLVPVLLTAQHGLTEA